MARFKSSPPPDPTIRVRDGGFDLISPEGGDHQESVDWVDVEQIDTYKVDLITIDCVYLSFKTGDQVVAVSEDWDGFGALSKEMLEEFPSVDEDWKTHIVLPPFEERRDVLFRKTDSV